ncbi:hypothetical protein PIB30_066565 [Stylosanthes scabra]|uniref:Putative plant transposon protein domain-containing protein n=1 Tax=Stylosanthes scabra TaxID=79078 RepID=A0ABU6QMY0_9FABA|nr:hypothetical protein [Stylosanthes scabra]
MSKLLVQEFYANAAVSDEEAAAQEELPYKSFVRGKEIDFSPNNIRRVMRFKRDTTGVLTDFKTRQASNQRLDEVLAHLCIPGATWKLSSSQPPIPIKLRRTELQPLTRGWQEFIIHSLVPTGNKSEITTSRAILIHTIMHGEDVRAEEIIAENMVTIAQGLGNKGNLAHPSTIYKLCKDAGFLDINNHSNKRMKKKMNLCLKRMEAILEKRTSNHNNKSSHHNKIISHNKMIFPTFSHTMKANTMRPSKASNHTYQACSFSSRPSMRTCRNPKRITWRRFHPQVWKEQEKLAKEVQVIRRGQMTQLAANAQRFKAERNLQLALERQGKRQINLWNNNVSSKEAHACWAQQQANPNLSEVPITQIPDIMRTNVEKGRPLFHGFLKSDYGASSSSQVDPEEPVPLRTAPPSPHFRPPYPPSN